MATRYDPEYVADVLRRQNGNVAATARELNCDRSTIYSYRKQFDIVDEAIRNPKPNVLPTVYEQSNDLIESMAMRSSLPRKADYTERDLQALVYQNINQVCAIAGWSFVDTASVEHTLPNRKRVDLLCRHFDGTISIIEVKAGGAKHSDPTWLLYSSIGQLVYYSQVISDLYDMPLNRIHTAVVGDFTPDPYWIRSLQLIKHTPVYINALESLSI